MSKSLFKHTIKNIIFGIIFAEFFVLILTLGNTLDDGLSSFKENAIENVGIMSVAVIFYGAVVIGIMTLYYAFSNFKRWLAIIDTEMYIREIPEEIPAAIASLLYDTYIETDKDYTATIAGLFAKGNIEISDRKIIVKNNDTSKLLEHEIYVLEVLTKKREFKKKEYRKTIINDAIKLKLFEEIDKKEILKKIIIFSILALITAGITLFCMYNAIAALVAVRIWVMNLWAVAMLFVFVIFLVFLFKVISYISPGYDQSTTYKYKKTELGLKYSVIVGAISKFFKDYTLIHERELESVTLLGEHIAYAIALDRTENIEEFIINDNAFRELMYMNKYTGRYKYDFFMYEKD